MVYALDKKYKSLNDLEEYKNYFNKLDVKVKLYYKKYYVLNNIIPKLELNPEFLNCSFIDIMCKKFSKKNLK